MSIRPEQNDQVQSPGSLASRGEKSSTSQRQHHESRAADVERGTTQNALPPGTPFEEIYIARPSLFVAHINHKGEIVHQQRCWVTAASLETYQNLPEIPPKGIRVVISNIGAVNKSRRSYLEHFTKTDPSHDVSRPDSIPYKIPWRENLRIIKQSGLYPLESGPIRELASLVGMKSVARLNAHRLQELCQKRAVPTNTIFVAQSNIFESSLPSRPFPDTSYMLHEQGPSACRLQSSARTWYSGLAGLSLRFWETLSEVSVQRNDNGSAEIFFTFSALRLPSVPETPDSEMVTPAQSSFETLLQSDQSSLWLLELIEGDAELTIRFIILDFCRASMELWKDFLRRLTTSITLPNPRSIGLLEYEKDLAHAIEFSSLVRDLCSCVSFLCSSIALDHFQEKSKDLRRWDHLLLEIRTLEAVLQNSVQQLLDIAKPKFDMAVANSTASQATSLERLTIIAVIFLPLSLASSLLAMTESVQDIGERWFDWLGLWLTMGFVVALVYSLWKSIDHLLARPLAGNMISELLKTLNNFFFPLLVPFFCVIVISFWTGMFDGLQAVPKTLKWGSIAFAGLVALRLLPYILRLIFKTFRTGSKNQGLDEVLDYYL